MSALSEDVPPVERLIERGGIEAVIEATLARWFTEAFRAGGGAEPARRGLPSDDVASWAANWHAIAGLDIAPRLHEIRAPTLCIVGEVDVASPPAAVAAIAERIPDARYTVMAGAAHALHRAARGLRRAGARLPRGEPLTCVAAGYRPPSIGPRKRPALDRLVAVDVERRLEDHAIHLDVGLERPATSMLVPMPKCM